MNLTSSSAWSATAERPQMRLDYLASPSVFLGLGALHALLATLYRVQPTLGAVHVLGTIAFGLVIAVRRPHRILGVVAYIAGAELLWRMNSVPVPYETGKLSCILLLLLALFSAQSRSFRSLLFLFAGGLYLPGILGTIDRFGLTETARAAVSFHLSGPIMFAVGAACLSVVRRPIDLHRVFAAFCIPVLGLGLFVLANTMAEEEIRYTTESNFQTSGGFGPNQVSLTLAFGAVALLALGTASRGIVTRVSMLALVGLLLSLSIFTFSRTGLYCAFGAALMLTSNLAVNRRRGVRVLLSLAALLVIGQILVFPRLDQTTGGKLGERFAETSPTTRVELMKADLASFRSNPILGVGPGVSRFERPNPRLVGLTAHTEYTRALAEHGIFGLAAMIVLFGGWALQFVGTWHDRWAASLALATGFASLLALGASAVRLSSIPLFLLLAFTLHPKRASEPSGPSDPSLRGRSSDQPKAPGHRRGSMAVEAPRRSRTAPAPIHPRPAQ